MKTFIRPLAIRGVIAAVVVIVLGAVTHLDPAIVGGGIGFIAAAFLLACCAE